MDLISNMSNHSNHSSSDHDASSNSTTTQDHSSPSMEMRLAKRESAAVSGLRLLVFAVLLLATMVVAILIYLYTSAQEQNDFEKAFQDNAFKILESLGSSLEQSMVGLDAFVIGMVSSAGSSLAQT